MLNYAYVRKIVRPLIGERGWHSVHAAGRTAREWMERSAQRRESVRSFKRDLRAADRAATGADRSTSPGARVEPTSVQLPPKVSVIVPTFCSGEGLYRVIDSLDAQTLPQDEFEAVFVDDGSPDDTYNRLQALAATRPNMRVLQIENSGWPGRPRNVGIDNARGDYVFFMDHDDSLYPDGLRRACEYAIENDSDMVSVQEFNTKRVWWANCLDRNIPDVSIDGGFDRLMPIMPHNLYRRRMLLDHGVRYPEQRRALWEGWYFNVAAYRHSRVTSVLMDAPVYLRHMDGKNTSRTFDLKRPEYWDCLEDVLQYIDKTLASPAFMSARDAAVAQHVRARILKAILRLPPDADPEMVDSVVGRARDLLDRFVSDGVWNLLSRKNQIQAHLLRESRYDLLRSFHDVDVRQRVRAGVEHLRWRDGALVAQLRCVWEPRSDGTPILREQRGRVVRVVGSELERAVPAELLDVTDSVGEYSLDLMVRSRANCASWQMPFELQEFRFEPVPGNGMSVVSTGKATLSLAAGAVGGPLPDDLWDVKFRSEWTGAGRHGAIAYPGPPKPALCGGRAAVAYGNSAGELSLDLARRTRTLAIDAKPRSGHAGSVELFATPLRNISVFGDDGVGVDTLVAVRDDALSEDQSEAERASLLKRLAVGGDLHAEVVVCGGEARLQGSARLQPGKYTIYAWRRGELRQTSRSLTVDSKREVRFG